MTQTYTRESSVSREKARAILASLDRADEYDPAGDYYLAWDADGEYLTQGGQDEPLAQNTSTTSWASPGHPASVEAMTYDVARSVSTGLYWGGGKAGEDESFCLADPGKAVAFGEGNRDYLDCQTEEEIEWVRFTAEDEA